MEKEIKEEDKTISNHIFMFPFSWGHKIDGECESNLGKDIIKFINNLKQGSDKWNYDKFVMDSEIKYRAYPYFYEYARNAMFSNEDEQLNNEDFKEQVVFNYKYSFDNGKYIIDTVGIEGNEEKAEGVYELDINIIQLKIYSTGVGILSFHLANEKYNRSNDILKINEFGRSVYPQYLPLYTKKDKKIDGVKGKILPYKVSIHIDENRIEETFDNSYKDNIPKFIISDTIMKLFGDGFIYDKNNMNDEDILITPVIDDRMFTLSVFKDNCVEDHKLITGYREEIKDYGYANNELWYKYLFVDSGDCTCQSKTMLTKLLKEHTYDRWTDWGTLYGLSRYSFVMYTSTGCPQYLIDTFNYLYFEMVCLALAQRASIIRFSNEVAHIGSLEDSKITQKVRGLYKDYITFINKIYFREITAQEQGIELYDMLVNFMHINNEAKSLDGELDELNRLIELLESVKKSEQNKRIEEENKKITNAINVFTYASGFYTALGGVIGIFTLTNYDISKSDYKWYFMAAWIVATIIGTAIALFCTIKITRRFLKKD